MGRRTFSEVVKFCGLSHRLPRRFYSRRIVLFSEGQCSKSWRKLKTYRFYEPAVVVKSHSTNSFLLGAFTMARKSARNLFFVSFWESLTKKQALGFDPLLDRMVPLRWSFAIKHTTFGSLVGIIKLWWSQTYSPWNKALLTGSYKRKISSLFWTVLKEITRDYVAYGLKLLKIVKSLETNA